MANLVKSNGATAITQLANSNPDVKSAQDYINQNGGNGQEAFMKRAREIGMSDNDISQFLSTLQGFIGG